MAKGAITMYRAVLPILTVLLPCAASAQGGLYIGGNVGVDLAGSLQSAQSTTRVDTDAGPLGLATIGWGFGNGLRAEIEGSYRSNTIGNISTRRNGGVLESLSGKSGSNAAYAMMANVGYDFQLHPFGLQIQPYIGAGLGYGWIDLHNARGLGQGRISLAEGNTYSGPLSVTLGSGGAFAYQAIVGASVPLAFFPGLSATLEYRFFGTARADVSITRIALTQSLINGSVPATTTHNGFETHDNAILIGLRYTFSSL